MRRKLRWVFEARASGRLRHHRDTFRKFSRLLNIAFLGNKNCNISQGDKICYKIVKRVLRGMVLCVVPLTHGLCAHLW